MPISLKGVVGGSDPVNSTKEIFTEDLLHVTQSGSKWLRTGWVDTSVANYPLATKTTTPLDITQTGVTHTADASICSALNADSSLIVFKPAVNPAKTTIAIPCSLTSDAVYKYAMFSTNSGVSWDRVTLTANTTHNYSSAAFSPTKCMFVGFDNTTNSNSSRFIKTTATLTSPTAPITLTLPYAMHVEWSGTSFLVFGANNQVAKVLEATDTITYLSNTSLVGTRATLSPTSGVVLAAGSAVGQDCRIIRTTDDGSTWSTVLNLPALSTGSIKALYKDPTSGKVFAVIGFKIFVSSDNGATWSEVTWGYTRDGVTYSSSSGVAPTSIISLDFVDNGIYRTTNNLRILARLNSTRFCYLQSTDNGVTWELTRDVSSPKWDEGYLKGTNGFTLIPAGDFGYVCVKDLNTPSLNPVYRLQGVTTFVGIMEELFTSITSTGGKLAKYIRVS